MTRLDTRPDGTPIPVPGVTRMLSGVPKVEKRLGASFRPANAPRELDQSLLEAAPSRGAALACLVAWHGDGALPQLESEFTHRARSSAAARLITSLGSRASRDALLRHLDNSQAYMMFLTSARRWPLDSLESLLRLNPRRGQRAADLFQILAWRHPDWVEALRDAGADSHLIDWLLAPEPGVDEAGTELPFRAHGDLPDVPKWFNPIRAPRLVLAGTGRAVPVHQVGDVVRNLMVDEHENTARCFTRASLAAFLADLLQQWRSCEVKGDEWVLARQSMGGEVNARLVTVLIKKFWQRSRWDRVLAGMEVLARIRSKVALLELMEIAGNHRNRGLGEQARIVLERLAEERGISMEQLAEQAIPDLGLDENGRLRLDFGPRQFEVRLNLELTPLVSTADGKTMRTLPRPGRKDDPVAAGEAVAEFREFKKQLAAVIRSQTDRLEIAMSTCRRWTQDEFRTVFLQHPVMRLAAQNLIWAAHDADERTVLFRVGDDLGLLDVHEEPVALPVGAVIGLAHPLEMSNEWTSHCIDYHMTPLVEQVGRSSYAEVPEFPGNHVWGEVLLGLGARGWKLHGDDRAGVDGLRRGLKGGHLDLRISTAFWSLGGSPPADPVRLLKAEIVGERSKMDPVELSEAIRDLVRLPWFSKS